MHQSRIMTFIFICLLFAPCSVHVAIVMDAKQYWQHSACCHFVHMELTMRSFVTYSSQSIIRMSQARTVARIGRKRMNIGFLLESWKEDRDVSGNIILSWIVRNGDDGVVWSGLSCLRIRGFVNTVMNLLVP
jgi:hypothetical protein